MTVRKGRKCAWMVSPGSMRGKIPASEEAGYNFGAHA